jgi:hypothetical protein
MKNEWEQFPPIEGNSTDYSGLALVAAICFAVGMIAYVFML